MADRNIRHVEDIFKGRVGAEPQTQTNMMDRKTSFNVYKNKKAPAPPQDGAKALPKIGNYQPKILLKSEDSAYSDNSNSYNFTPAISESRNSHTSHSPVRHEHFIIGDKDVPLKIESNVEDADDMPVPAPRRKRRAPSVPEVSEIKTDNPLFGRSVSQRSDEKRFVMDMEEQGGDIDFGEGIDNSGYSFNERKESSSSWENERFQSIPEERQNLKNGQYPYIPPPDYDDEEMTFEFGEENDKFVDHNRNSTLYKEFEGEDYGKYLDEENDYEFDAPVNKYQRRAQNAHIRPGPHQPSKQVETKKETKPKKKHKQKEVTKRSTIRDFAFSDSKIGWGDRTVKSTSAKGRYIKREKDRRRIGKTDTFEQNGGPTSGSYEEFLRVKNGLPLESPNSSDSGVDLFEDGPQRDMYLKSQPKQMRSGQYDHKPSMWQRLTWRFKKSVNITKVDR